LIYKPDANSDKGWIELPIARLTNPLEGVFDLSKCGDTGQYLTINTGYRKSKKAENDSKIEIWFAPRFLVEKEINTTAQHFKEIFPANWPINASIGIFWTLGRWDNLVWHDYLTHQNLDILSNGENLYKKWESWSAGTRGLLNRHYEDSFFIGAKDKISCFTYEVGQGK
jgi:hypothetical protein